jgi:4-amino-4-deoxy-L-arabinose transferase-like glycosyltransferase
MSLAAGLTFAAMPVVVNLAHEAKPHLPATALMLLAIIAAIQYVQRGQLKWAAIAGVLVGACFGIVLSGLLAFAILLAMVFIRREDKHRRIPALAISISLAVLTYAITNPFVIINLIARPERFQSNLHNSTNMYATTSAGATTALRLIMEGTSPLLAFVGVCGVFFLAREKTGKLLLAPVALVLIMFIALAAGKPPEYARFALPLDATLLIAAFTALGRARHHWPRIALATILFAATIASSLPYWNGFVRDTHPTNSRIATAKLLINRQQLRIQAEPAPYCMPPVNLFTTKLLLVPPTEKPDLVVDRQRAPNSMSWANIKIEVSSP